MSDQRNARLGIYGGHSDGTENLGLDRFENLQEPKIDPGQDPLARFVVARIIEAELEPRGEVMAAYDHPAGPIAYRYAKGVRADMVAFRRIVQRYVEASEALDAAEHPAKRSALGLFHAGISEAMREVACRWSAHPDFDQAWSIE